MQIENYLHSVLNIFSQFSSKLTNKEMFTIDILFDHRPIYITLDSNQVISVGLAGLVVQYNGTQYT